MTTVTVRFAFYFLSFNSIVWGSRITVKWTFVKFSTVFVIMKIEDHNFSYYLLKMLSKFPSSPAVRLSMTYILHGYHYFWCTSQIYVHNLSRNHSNKMFIINPRTWQSSCFSHFLQHQSNSVITVCTSMSSGKTGTAHSWFGISLIVLLCSYVNKQGENRRLLL